MKAPRGQAYPAASALPTRASSAEAQPDEGAATALDRPVLGEEAIAAWSQPTPKGPAPSTSRAPCAERPGPTLAAPAGLAWVALALLGVACGVAGAFLGVWLALGGA